MKKQRIQCIGGGGGSRGKHTPVSYNRRYEAGVTCYFAQLSRLNDRSILSKQSLFGSAMLKQFVTANDKMSHSLPSIASRCCQRNLRPASSLYSQSLGVPLNYSRQRRKCILRRWLFTDTAATQAINPKITGIVDQISQLTLLETADLVASLKVCRCRSCQHPWALKLTFAVTA